MGAAGKFPKAPPNSRDFCAASWTPQGWGLASVGVSRSPHMVLHDVYPSLEAVNFDISVLGRAISSHCARGQLSKMGVLVFFMVVNFVCQHGGCLRLR